MPSSPFPASNQANILPAELHPKAYFPYWRLKYIWETWTDFLFENLFSYEIQIRGRGTWSKTGGEGKKENEPELETQRKGK